MAIARRAELAEQPEAFATNEETIRRLHAELTRGELLIAKRQADVEEATRQAERDRFRKAWRSVEAAAEAANAEAEKLAKAAKTAASAADTRAGARRPRSGARSSL